MAFALPLAGGIAGNFLGGSLGAQIGFLAGSWLYNTQFAKGNEIIDPGAEEAPRFNQALRGTTMNVLFGTNRVSANIIWQDNFTTNRVEQGVGGGGKGGGSGGGKQGGGGSSISYEYFWDLIYHLGMVPEGVEYNIFDMWIGGEKADPDSILSMTSITSSTSEIDGNSRFFGDATQLDGQDAIAIDAEEAVFHGGGAASDGWAYFQTQIGGSKIRYPHTVWFGYKQIALGNYPRIPQLTAEVGPGGADISFNPEFLGFDPNSQSNAQQKAMTGIGDKFGQMHVAEEAGNFTGFDSAGNVIYNKSMNQILDELELINPGSVIGSSGTGETGVGTIQNGNYLFILIAHNTGLITPSNVRLHYIVAQVVDGGAPVVLGGMHADKIRYFPRFKWCGISGSRSTSELILAGISNDTGDTTDAILVCPSISDLISGNSAKYGGTGRTIGFFRYSLPTSGGSAVEDFIWNENAIEGLGNKRNLGAFVLPKATISLGISYTPRVYMYVSKGMMEYHKAASGNPFINPYIRNVLQPSNTNGAMIYWEIGTVDLTAFIAGMNSNDESTIVGPAPVNANADFDSNMPMTDEYLTATTPITATMDSYDNNAYTEILSQKDFVVALSMAFNNAQDSDNFTKQYMRVRAFQYDALTQKFSHVGQQFGVLYTASDLGVTGGFPSLSFDETFRQVYRTATSKICLLGKHGAAGGSPSPNYMWSACFGDLTVDGGGDVYPPYIIREILTSNVFGIGLTGADLNLTSYTDAIQYCIDENIQVSTQWPREGSSLAIIQQCLTLYGGFLTESDGLIKFGVLDASSTSLITLDNDHFVSKRSGQPPVRITKGARQDTYNKVKVNYIDRLLDYRQNQVEESDEVDQDETGIRSQEFPAQFVMKEDLARKVAIRALLSNLYAKDFYNFTLGWKDSIYEPGDVVTLVDSHSTLNTVARIVRRKERQRGKFDIDAIQELAFVLSASASALDATSATIFSPFNKTPPPRFQTMYELPNEYSVDASASVFVGWMADGFAAGARLFLSTDGITYTPAADIDPFPVAGALLTDMPSSGEFAENVEVIIVPKSIYSANSAYIGSKVTLNESTAATRASGLSTIRIGSEMLAYEGVNLVSQNRYRFDRLYRGWGGTFIHSHNSGDFFVRRGSGVFSFPVTEDRIGTNVSYKVAPFNINGTIYDVASIDASSYTILGTGFGPQNPPTPRLIVGSTDMRGDTKRIVAASADIHLDWRDSAVKHGYGAGGYGAGGYGRFEADATSHSYTINVVGSGDVLVHSTSVLVPAYTYAGSQNAADNGDWRGNVAISVFAQNAFARSSRTETVSLELFS